VGCSAGQLGMNLKKKSNVEVIGIEFNEDAAKIASNYLDEVFVGNVEDLDLSSLSNYFDCIIYADILEHLSNPWDVVAEHKKLLKSEGFVIISVPNIRHIHTFSNLLRGNWKYVDRGIFDKTHLRFFTLKSITQMLHDVGYNIVSVNRNYRLFENKSSFANLAKMLSFWYLRDFFTFQYLILAKK
jgi:2-polyprenyl-3-methyl-5-hydroxy-6-metoxy-1,4-benzoquinol methylase